MTCQILIPTVTTRIMGPVAWESVRHVLEISQALRLDLIVTDTRLINATNLALLNITKSNDTVNKNSKTGKMTVVVKAMKVFGSKYSNSRNSSFGKLLNKPNKWLNLKKEHPNRSKKHHNGLIEPITNVSERQVIK